MMWKIKVITDGLCENDVNTIYFAAEELKKYGRLLPLLEKGQKEIIIM